jgi:O-succinylbenzoate synthase
VSNDTDIASNSAAIVSNDTDIASNSAAIVDARAYTDTREGLIRADFAAADANLQSQIDSNRSDIERNARGIAMVAALQHTTVLPGMNNAFDLSAAHFEGETGLALNYARRINENVQINFGAASTTDFDESVIKAGIGVQW